MGLFDLEDVGENTTAMARDDVITNIYKLAYEKGRKPVQRDLGKVEYLPSKDTIRKEFGSWNSLLHESGFLVNEKHDDKGNTQHVPETEVDKKGVVYEEVEMRTNEKYIIEDHTPKSKGEASEHMIAAELMLRNVTVSSPIGENTRYDLLIEYNDEFHRVQCKTGKLRDGIITFSTMSHRPNSNEVIKESYDGQIDYFAVYCWETEQIFIMPINETATGRSTLRLNKPKNNQIDNVNFAAEYELDRVLSNGTLE